ncbi:MAG: hypothetical protein Q9157_006349 [Trypethelium eluteriae]
MEHEFSSIEAEERPRGPRPQLPTQPSRRPSRTNKPKLPSQEQLMSEPSNPPRLDLLCQGLPTSAPNPNPTARIRIGSMNSIREIADGNTCLFRNEPVAALKLYTANLTQQPPGNPCAFLNRCLCYLALGFPELAVVDAQRALLAFITAFGKDKASEMAFSKLERFVTWTAQADSNQYPWVRAPTSNYKMRRHMDDLLVVPLAALTVRSRINPGENTSVSRIRASVLLDGKSKAMYRIAYSLWKCGGGALMDGLDVTQQGTEVCPPADKKYFTTLANRILLDLEKLLKKEALYTRLQALDQYKFEASDSQKQHGVRDLQETRFTTIRRQAYPWDEIGNSVDKPLLVETREYVEDKVSGCAVDIIVDENGNRKPALFACKDFTAEETLFSECNPFHVVSVESEAYSYCEACATRLAIPLALAYRLQNFKPSTSRSSSQMMDGSNLQTEHDRVKHTGASPPSPVSKPALDNLQGPVGEIPSSPRPSPASFRPCPSGVSPRSPVSSESLSPNPSSHKSNISVHSVMSPISDSAKDLQLCQSCHLSTFCSRTCLKAANATYHSRTCELDLEFSIRTHIQQSAKHPSVPSPHLQALRNLMLVKILAHSLQSGTPLLEIPELLLAPSNLAPADPIIYLEGMHDRNALANFANFRALQRKGQADLIDQEALRQSVIDELASASASSGSSLSSFSAARLDPDALPWSYVSNVLLPLGTLAKLEGMSAVLDVRRFEGWVLNTVMTKIADGMRVVRPMWHKEFDEEGMLGKMWRISREEKEQGRGMEREGNEKQQQSQEEDDVWVGSLQPLLELIGVVGEGDGKAANVEIDEKSGKVVVVGKRAEEEGGEKRMDSGVGGSEEFGEIEEMAERLELGKQSREGLAVVIRKGERILREDKGSEGDLFGPDERKFEDDEILESENAMAETSTTRGSGTVMDSIETYTDDDVEMVMD